MNKREFLNVVITGTAGIAVGYGVGVFVSDLRYKKAMKQILDEMVNELQAATISGYDETVSYAQRDNEAVSDLVNRRSNFVTVEEQEEYTEKIESLHYSAANDEAIIEDEQEAVEKIDELRRRLAEGSEMHDETLSTVLSEDETESNLEETIAKGREFVTNNLVNVFDRADEIKDEPNDENTQPGALFGARTLDEPFVISIGEYLEDYEYDEGPFDKLTVAYFEEDDTLLDEREQIIDDIEHVVGQANLNRFGQGSENDDIVYVRNTKMRADFEIMREQGSYAEQILGYRPDKTKNRPRTMRDLDEE